MSKIPYIIVELEDAKYWARFSSGAIRPLLWADAVKRMERIEARGVASECRWWPAKTRPHPACESHGMLEVREAILPKVSVRSRTRV